MKKICGICNRGFSGATVQIHYSLIYSIVNAKCAQLREVTLYRKIYRHTHIYRTAYNNISIAINQTQYIDISDILIYRYHPYPGTKFHQDRNTTNNTVIILSHEDFLSHTSNFRVKKCLIL